MELSNVQLITISSLMTSFDEERLYVYPARDKKTGKTVPVLFSEEVSEGETILIPIAKVFTPGEDYPHLDYEFDLEGGEDGSQEVDGIKFVYNTEYEEEAEVEPEPPKEKEVSVFRRIFDKYIG